MDRQERQLLIRSIASEQRGSTAYLNLRSIYFPRRCAGLKLIDALESYHPAYGRDRWLAAIESNEILRAYADGSEISGSRVSPDQIAKEGEHLIHRQANFVEPSINPNIELVYEDELLVVINKSAPLPLHPSGRFNRNTLEAILNAAYAPEKLRPAHRIDSNTTGLIIFTRSAAAAAHVQTQFAGGKVSKLYLAYVEGNPTWDTMACDAPIMQEPMPNGGRKIDRAGRSALTHFRVVERSVHSSVIEAKLETGRTHQIRLHLAHLGHPLINEPLYLAGGGSRPYADEHRMLLASGLHAWKTSFTHPVSEKTISFESPPRD